ncbi:hypothetical protein EXU48_02155 [Occultella glacieicola]|uniref:Uncharacterized protein n=1 Tax=Occultella glacieicola TaxID=2518684 RepID=A0ABY2E927_9MICO|nr:hypothetical protein [Occultella glacieicola]TDE99011.1 hypothetical protein EXU48_02155 [Occultella glacieicola]
MPDGAARVLQVGLAEVQHLLLLGADVTDEEVEALALSRFPEAGRVNATTLALTPTAAIEGPWEVADPGLLGVGVELTQAYAITVPAERGDPVPEHLRGLGGILDAFAGGQPQGHELAIVEFAQAAARRLGGTLRVAGTGALIVPEPGVDLAVHSEVWLHPDALVHVLTPALPGVSLDLGADPGPDAGAHRASPTPRPAAAAPAGTEELDDGERAWIHAEADAYDAHALAAEPATEAYGAVCPLPDGGTIAVEVEAEVSVPLVLEGLDWARSGVIRYDVRWFPVDPEAYHAGPTGARMVAARDRATALVEGAARALLEAIGGETTDDDGFLVDP